MTTRPNAPALAAGRCSFAAAVFPVDERDPACVAPGPSLVWAVTAAVAGLLPAPFAAFVARLEWLFAAVPARRALVVVRLRLVCATAEPLDEFVAALCDAAVWLSGVWLVETGCVGDVVPFTGEVWTGGTVTVGVLRVGVVMLGTLIVGVVMLGVLTVPTPTDGTVIGGTVTVGTEIVGTEIVGTAIVGTETVGTDACAPEAAHAANAPHAPARINARRLMSPAGPRGPCVAQRRTTYRRTRPSKLQNSYAPSPL